MRTRAAGGGRRLRRAGGMLQALAGMLTELTDFTVRFGKWNITDSNHSIHLGRRRCRSVAWCGRPLRLRKRGERRRAAGTTIPTNLRNRVREKSVIRCYKSDCRNLPKEVIFDRCFKEILLIWQMRRTRNRRGSARRNTRSTRKARSPKSIRRGPG